jgi:predicted ester cyclase
MAIEENKIVFYRWFEETWNNGNLAVVEELTANNFVLHAPGPGVPPGVDGFKQIVSVWRTAFPSGTMTVDDLIAGEDKVVVRWTASGTQTGQYFGISPTGKQVTWTGITIYRIADGKLQEGWGELDMLGMMQQLDVIPQPSQGEE